MVSFVNELVSDEDVIKYDLHGIWDQYHPFQKGRYFLGNQPSWTIDRELNVFFMPISQGNREHGNRKTCLLWWNGHHVIVTLDLAKESSAYFDEEPFKRVWHLVRLDVPDYLSVSRGEVIDVLKKALVAYGYRGARRQIPNTVVMFDF